MVFDDRSFQARVAEFARALTRAAELALTEGGLQLLRDCYNVPPTVPVRTGYLRSSATLHVFGKLKASGTDFGYKGWSGDVQEHAKAAVVRFNAPYAAVVHEGTHFSFKHPGSGAKYLESKMRDQEKYFGIIVETLKQRLREAGF